MVNKAEIDLNLSVSFEINAGCITAEVQFKLHQRKFDPSMSLVGFNPTGFLL